MRRMGKAEPATFSSALMASWRVIWAVMLRDIRTRFFNHGLGYIIAIAFPLAHILILLGVYKIAGRAAPFGENAAVFFGVGLAPFMAWNYMSRFIMLSLVVNRPLLAFPAVHILDVLLGRALLEVLASCCMAVLLLGLGVAFGLDIAPHDTVDAALAWLAALGLGLGFGMVSALIAQVAPGWVTVYFLSIIVFYLASGIIFLPAEQSDRVLEYLTWLPTLHLVEWMRVAWFDGYSDRALDRTYVASWAIASIFLGLALERLMRGRLMGG